MNEDQCEAISFEPARKPTNNLTCPICGRDVGWIKWDGALAMVEIVPIFDPTECPMIQPHACPPYVDRPKRPDGPTPLWVLTRILTTLELMQPMGLTAKMLAESDFSSSFPRRLIWEALTELRRDGLVQVDQHPVDPTLSYFSFVPKPPYLEYHTEEDA